MRRPVLAATCSALLVVSVLSRVEPAQAQNSPAAEELYRRGVANFQAGRYDLACKELSESYRMEELPGVLFTWATCEARAGRVASASAHYRDFLDFVAHLTPEQRLAQTEREEVAAKERAALLPRIPYLTLEVGEPLPPGTVIELDGAVLGESALGHEMPIDPGEHSLRVKLADGATRDTKLELELAEHERVRLELPARVAATPSAPAPASGMSSSKKAWIWASGSVAVSGIAVGAVGGILALGHKSVVDEHCNGPACDPEGLAAAEAGQTAALVSTVGFAVGGAGLVTFLVLLATGSDAPPPRLGTSWGERWSVGARGVTMQRDF